MDAKQTRAILTAALGSLLGGLALYFATRYIEKRKAND